MRASRYKAGRRLLLVAGICLAAGNGFAQSSSTSAKTQRPTTHTPASHPATAHPAVRHATSALSHTSSVANSTHHSSTYASQRKGSARRRYYSHSHQPTAQQRLARLHLDPDRVKQIQQALTREGYLQADPSGEWDPATRQAMLRYQTMHGFPPTGLPEAKSLMKLGLGPHPLAPELDHAEAGVAPGAVITPVQNVFSVSTSNPSNPATTQNNPEPNPATK